MRWLHFIAVALCLWVQGCDVVASGETAEVVANGQTAIQLVPTGDGNFATTFIIPEINFADFDSGKVSGKELRKALSESGKVYVWSGAEPLNLEFKVDGAIKPKWDPAKHGLFSAYWEVVQGPGGTTEVRFNYVLKDPIPPASSEGYKNVYQPEILNDHSTFLYVTPYQKGIVAIVQEVFDKP